MLVLAAAGLAVTATAAEPVSVWITFGHGDTEPTEWQGQLEVTGGRLVKLRGWHFEGSDAINGRSWKAATRRRAARRKTAKGPVLPNGLIAELEADGHTRILLTTSRGKVDVAVSELGWGRPAVALDGAVRIQRVPVPVTAPIRARAAKAEDPELLPGLHIVPPHIPDENVGNSQEDYPAVAVTADGAVWVAWNSFLNGKVDLRIASFDGRQWSKPAVLAPPGDIFTVALAAVGRQLWCVWSAQQDRNWDLFGRRYDGAKWQQVQRLTEQPGADLFPRLASAGGRLYLVWQGVRGADSKVLTRTWHQGHWSQEVLVDATPGNQWLPAVAAEPAGADGDAAAWVAWDTYHGDSYDVRVARLVGSRVQHIMTVADTARFEANAGLAVGPDGSVAVAWEQSAPNWGKDSGQLGPKQGTTGLYPSRSIQLAIYRHGRWWSPPKAVDQSMPPDQRSFLNHPRPVYDSDGRLWVVFRRRNTKYYYPWPRGIWETYVTVSDGTGGWLPAIYCPASAGGCMIAPDVVKDRRGGLWLAWSTDERPWRRPIPYAHRVVLARIDGRQAAGGPPKLQPRQAGQKAKYPVVHVNESAAVARMRAHRWQVGDSSLRILRGDMHRHTDVSWDGTNDGSLIDMYRYALDAAALDFIASTEHVGWGFADRGNQAYAWWRNEQLCDALLRPRRFLTLYAYERSMHYPFGHRNVISPRRGIPPVMSFLTPDGKIAPDDTRRLYERLHDSGSLAMSHTSATVMGTDWADNDPAIEPLVEIYQACRLSYERPGGPRAARKPGKYDAGFVSNALAKGYRLGFQSSSDHFGTHMSYSCLYVRDFSRHGILEALRARRAYGATDNIVVEFAARDGSGTHLLGQSFQARGPVRLRARVIGTGPIKRIVVIRSNQVVYAQRGSGNQVSFEYTDMSPPADNCFYYIRVEQADGQLAWASPIWVQPAEPKPKPASESP